MGYNEIRPRGPIAAQYKGPGPVYNLPSLIGKPNHDPRSTYKEGPAYSFGVRHGKIKDDASPGPIYLPDLKYSRYGLDYSPRFSVYGRSRDLSMVTKVPGPGAYSPENVPVLESPRAPAYSFGARTNNRKSDANPAPNTYYVPPLMGSSGPSFSLKGRSTKGGFHEDLSQSPGPGHYKMTSPDVYRRRGPQHSITGRTHVVGDNTLKPGPGAHSPEKVTIHKPRGPHAPFGVRHSEYEAPFILPED